MQAPKTTIGRARELRRQMTLPEVVLWQAMRKGRLAGLHDARRDAWLARQGVTVLRFAATDVLKDDCLEGILVAIEQAAAAVAPSTASGGPPPPAGEDQDGV